MDGRILLLLRQVDDFCIGCTDKQDAKNIYNLIVTTTSLPLVHVNDPDPDLSNDELVTLQLKEQNRNSDYPYVNSTKSKSKRE